MKPSTKAALHVAYLVGIALKGLDGLLETAGGVVLLLISRPAIVHLTELLVQGELSEDPRDLIATHALHAARNLSPRTQQFASAHVLVHGAINVGLVRGWRRAYPVALLLLTAFIGYQCFRLVLYHSVLLAAFTAIDICNRGADMARMAAASSRLNPGMAERLFKQQVKCTLGGTAADS